MSDNRQKIYRELNRLRWVMIGGGAFILILKGVVFIKDAML